MPRYAVSGYGERLYDAEGAAFGVIVLVAHLQAESREQALSQLIWDCPGGVITTCTQVDGAPAQGRFEGLPISVATCKLAPAELLERAEQQISLIAERCKAHNEQMRINERRGRTDDAAYARIDREYPWPLPAPAYPLRKAQP
ncbi:MAG: hypothetical protein Q4C67_07910 [Deinococcus sp.]|nr:hypothetical protein [Deinococcus sp.]